MSRHAATGVGGTDSAPLAGLRVLDLSHIIAGPFCATVLADLGADVIKVEPPGTGERGRLVQPRVGPADDQVGAFFQTLSRSRRGVVLDLKSEPGREAFLDLVARSDILLENFAPGTMDRLGFDYAALRAVNPGLIYAAITGFGQLPPYQGPYSPWRANNATSQAMSGLMDLSGAAGGPPAFVGGAVGDTVPGLWAVVGILGAVAQRQLTGQGRYLDIAMYDCLIAMCYNALTDYHATGRAPTRGDGWQPTFTTGLRCQDGYIAVSMWAAADGRWDALWHRIGQPQMVDRAVFDPEHPGCPTCAPAAKTALESWLAGVDRWTAVPLLLDLGFSAGPVQTADEVYHCPQVSARELLVDIDEGERSIRTAGFPIRALPAMDVPPTPAPRLGEHTAEVLADVLGYPPERIAAVLDGATSVTPAVPGGVGRGSPR